MFETRSERGASWPASQETFLISRPNPRNETGMMQAAVRVLGWVVAAAIVLGAAPRVPGGEPAPGVPQTPETRTLSPEEAGQALERDWLFQAMGEPLLPRAAKEIGWARDLAARLARQRPAACARRVARRRLAPPLAAAEARQFLAAPSTCPMGTFSSRRRAATRTCAAGRSSTPTSLPGATPTAATST